MTFREKLMNEQPCNVRPDALGGCVGCPCEYGYERDDQPCYLEHTAGVLTQHEACAACWDRQIPETEGKKVVFISGPITGVEHYWEPFEKAMDELEAEGYIPLTPTWQPKGLTRAQYMRICLAMIDVADAVLFLPGWRSSKGSLTEMNYCLGTDKPYSYTIEGIGEVLG